MRRKPAPVLIECMTFRMRGHEEASGVKYVPPELIEAADLVTEMKQVKHPFRKGVKAQPGVEF